MASTIKNVAFSLPAHPVLLSPSGINILPYLLLPLAGPEEFSEDENDQLLEELQYLPLDKKRDSDCEILKTHLETLLLLTSIRQGRDTLREKGVYLVVRECHAAVEDEGVREGCERLVQVLMRDEEGDVQGGHERDMHALGRFQEAKKRDSQREINGEAAGRMVTQDDVEEEDEDDQIVEVF